MNNKITNEIDEILDNELEEKSSSKFSIIKNYLFKFIIAILVISILLLPLITIDIKYFFLASAALLIIFGYFSTRKVTKKEEKWWRGERID
ncbi:MAG: hypothetical protein CL708_01115 [Chloroflexi bacterium]|nr:hypothetical protein [Chloroflexota bacterium]|tara:strand:- start:18 stop:290 length:273 start_codon:yes stop_codon:yes gene_type:complete